MLLELFSWLDPSMFLVLLGFLGFNFNQQDDETKQQQASNSGFLESDKNPASNYTWGQLRDVSQLGRNQLYDPIPQFNFSKNIPGLFAEQEGAATAFANNMFGKASAGGAMRGQYSPMNTPGIVGSAIRNMGATLFPIIGQNLQNAMLLPEQIRAQRFQNAMTPLQALMQGLGSSATGNTYSNESGLGFGFDTRGSGGAGQMLGKG